MLLLLLVLVLLLLFLYYHCTYHHHNYHTITTTTTKGSIHINNYSKTTARGVKDYKLDLDGKIIYMGSLKCSYDEFDKFQFRRSQSILFNNSSSCVMKYRDTINYCGASGSGGGGSGGEQEV